MAEFELPKIVGRRKVFQQQTPQEYIQRAWILQKSVNELNPFPKPRGFIFKAKSWEEYEAWRKSQVNPRLW
jgi:hypothetical protein